MNPGSLGAPARLTVFAIGFVVVTLLGYVLGRVL